VTDEAKVERAQKRVEPVMLLAALLVIPTIGLQATHVSHRWRLAASVLDWAIWAAFACELVLLTSLARNRRRFLLAHPVEVAIVVLTPPFLPAALATTRLLRLFRLLRLARFAQLTRRVFSLEGLRYLGLIAFLLVVGGGVAFASVERRQHLSPWDGIWWSITTITTVSYGDIRPETTAGRVLAIVTIVIGLALVALFTAAAAERFIRRRDEAESETVARLHAVEAEMLAQFEQIALRLAAIERALDQPGQRAFEEGG
jgi:voltage-gated potassium channel